MVAAALGVAGLALVRRRFPPERLQDHLAVGPDAMCDEVAEFATWGG